MEASLTVASAMAVLLVSGPGCDHRGGPPMKPVEETKTLSATLELLPSGNDWSIGFTLNNPTAQAIDATIHEPFASFTVEVATDDGKRLELVQPALDVPVHPVPFHLGAGETMRLATPFRLRFDPKVPPAGGDDPFLWSIASVRVSVVISARLTIEGLAPIAAQAHLHPG
ncbi:MAG TPA: hypothetical protein VF516_09565 [Kofleriaceae bacterium]